MPDKKKSTKCAACGMVSAGAYCIACGTVFPDSPGPSECEKVHTPTPGMHRHIAELYGPGNALGSPAPAIVERIKAAIAAGERFVRIEHRDGLETVHRAFVWDADHPDEPSLFKTGTFDDPAAALRLAENTAEIVQLEDGHRWIDLSTVRLST